MNHYAYGRRKEHKVAKLLHNKGARVLVNPGSRGAADMTVRFSSVRVWKVQAKSSRGCSPASPSGHDLARLKQSASRSRATAVVAKVTPSKIVYTSARTGSQGVSL